MKAVDSSVLVAGLLEWHEHHDVSRRALVGAFAPAHALLEAYSVLTRLPRPLSAHDGAELLSRAFERTRVLVASSDTQRRLVERCASSGVAGGAVYDALIGLTAQEHGAVLVSRDQRAGKVYELLGVGVEWV